MTDYRSPLLDRAGAVPADGPDEGIALHYGDPMAEQRALAEDVGWVDRSNREIVAVPGEDRLTWLHSLTSQHLTELADGRATEALILSPHGHVEHHMQLADLGGTAWLDVEPGTAESMLPYLDSMRFWSKVEPADVTGEWALLGVVGPSTGSVLAALGVVAGPEPLGVAELPAGGWVRRMPWPDTDAADLLVPRADLAAVAETLTEAGARPAGSWAFEALRVEARRPRLGFETDHRTIPHEVGWIGLAVHLDKGCYRGQETVARVHNLGKPPRRLVLLHLDGTDEAVPERGAPIVLGERQVGFVGTGVRHYELGPIALGLVKRNVADDADLRIGAVAAAIDA
ncbi:MAG TPA: glycine cleavage T C-terminal barrel domain-containing protein [Mycobacteriales bacterium]|nr:glycine cleavage T C-terminal barrel domain-containing protein [Mycobacteriales bacterium]